MVLLWSVGYFDIFLNFKGWERIRIPLDEIDASDYLMKFYVITSSTEATIAIDDVAFYKKSCENCKINSFEMKGRSFNCVDRTRID